MVLGFILNYLSKKKRLEGDRLNKLSKVSILILMLGDRDIRVHCTILAFIILKIHIIK